MFRGFVAPGIRIGWLRVLPYRLNCRQSRTARRAVNVVVGGCCVHKYVVHVLIRVLHECSDLKHRDHFCFSFVFSYKSVRGK